MHAEHADGNRLNDLPRQVIGRAFSGINTLGAGFLEKVYGNALAQELRTASLSVVRQCGVKVHYNDAVVGEYLADLVVEGQLLVELKTVKALDDVHRLQCANYLKAGGLRSVNHTVPSACFAFIRFHPRKNSFFPADPPNAERGRKPWTAASPQGRPPQEKAIRPLDRMLFADSPVLGHTQSKYWLREAN